MVECLVLVNKLHEATTFLQNSCESMKEKDIRATVTMEYLSNSLMLSDLGNNGQASTEYILHLYGINDEKNDAKDSMIGEDCLFISIMRFLCEFIKSYTGRTLEDNYRVGQVAIVVQILFQRSYDEETAQSIRTHVHNLSIWDNLFEILKEAPGQFLHGLLTPFALSFEDPFNLLYGQRFLMTKRIGEAFIMKLKKLPQWNTKSMVQMLLHMMKECKQDNEDENYIFCHILNFMVTNVLVKENIRLTLHIRFMILNSISLFPLHAICADTLLVLFENTFLREVINTTSDGTVDLTVQFFHNLIEFNHQRLNTEVQQNITSAIHEILKDRLDIVTTTWSQQLESVQELRSLALVNQGFVNTIKLGSVRVVNPIGFTSCDNDHDNNVDVTKNGKKRSLAMLLDRVVRNSSK